MSRILHKKKRKSSDILPGQIWLTPAQVAGKYGVSLGWLRERIRNSDGPPHRKGYRTVSYHILAVNDWFEKAENSPKNAKSVAVSLAPELNSLSREIAASLPVVLGPAENAEPVGAEA
jgi:hypothetical protein